MDISIKWLHTVIGNAKSFVGGDFHGSDSGFLQDSLEENRCRFNCRRFKDELFFKLACAVADFNILCSAV